MAELILTSCIGGSNGKHKRPIQVGQYVFYTELRKLAPTV